VKYFKNTELAKIYKVSEKSVRNWVQATLDGKLDLQLYENDGKSYIANTPTNATHIKRLVEKGKKYKNKRSYKVIEPSPEFYETYDTKQIFDIISSLTIYSEVPLQYSYVDNGATYWDKYTERMATEESNMLVGTKQLLESRLGDIDYLINGHKQVNVVDLGPGNGRMVQELLSHLLETGRLNRYIAIDVSRKMLDIAEHHIKEWFGDRVKFEGHIRDFSHERFDDLFAEAYEGDDENIPLNIAMLFGGTLCNMRLPSQSLQAINSSLGLNDLFLYGTKLDTPNSRRYFDFGFENKPRPLDFLFRVVIDKLNLKEPLYEIYQLFDQEKQGRFIYIKPTVDLSIEFKLAKGTRRVHLHKGEPILLWRYWHQKTLDVINQFDQTGFDLMQATKSNDQEYILLISKIRTTN